MKHDKYISDETVVKRVNSTVRIESERKRVLDVPIVTYDRETQIIYQENSDVRGETGRRRRMWQSFTKRKPERIKFPFRHFCLT